MNFIKQYINQIKRYKKGIIIGIAVGLIAASYTISQGADLSTLVTAGGGIIDSVFNRADTTAIAQTQVYVAFAFVGAVAGAIINILFRGRR